MFKKTLKILFLISSIFLNLSILFCDDILVEASISDTEIAVGSRLMYTIKVSGTTRLSAPNIPAIDGVITYGSGTSTRISVVNGQTSSNFLFNYIIVPSREGNFSIPEIEIDYQGKTYRTNSVSFSARQNPETPQKQNISQSSKNFATPPSNSQSQNKISKRGNKNIFVENEINKKSVFINEPIILTFKVYSRVAFLEQPIYKAPETNSFWKEDAPERNEAQKVNYNETLYYMLDKKTILYPTLPGAQQIGSTRLECVVEEPIESDDFWGISFGSRARRMNLETDPIDITVKPLPADGKPDSFKGAVGDYKMDVKILPESDYKTGETITLDVTISGRGNINTINEPSLSDFVNFKKYDTVSKNNISRDNYGLKGSKNFKIVLVPLVPGDLKMPELEFSFFNYQTKKYVVNKKNFGVIKVAKNADPFQVSAQNQLQNQDFLNNDIKIINSDIRFIKTKENLKYQQLLFYKSTIFLILLLFFPSIFLLLLLLKFYINYISKNKVQISLKRADSLALQKLEKLEKNSATENFIIELNSIFVEFLRDKFEIKQKIFSLSELKQILQTKKISQNKIENYERIWMELEFIKFANKKLEAKDRENLVQTLKNSIRNLE